MEERHVELLIGQRVYGPDARSVGRLEEIHAQPHDGHYIVTEYHLGPTALLERLAVRHLPAALVRLSTMVTKRPLGYIAKWDQLDLSEANHLTLCCGIEELKAILPK
jgi:hypothetical protein